MSSGQWFHSGWLSLEFPFLAILTGTQWVCPFKCLCFCSLKTPWKRTGLFFCLKSHGGLVISWGFKGHLLDCGSGVWSFSYHQSSTFLLPWVVLAVLCAGIIFWVLFSFLYPEAMWEPILRMTLVFYRKKAFHGSRCQIHFPLHFLSELNLFFTWASDGFICRLCFRLCGWIQEKNHVDHRKSERWRQDGLSKMQSFGGAFLWLFCGLLWSF